jgi:hypothetical protein
MVFDRWVPVNLQYTKCDLYIMLASIRCLHECKYGSTYVFIRRQKVSLLLRKNLGEV